MKIYFDNAATAPMTEEAMKELFEATKNTYANASSTHGFGRDARAKVERARENVAYAINAQAGEVFFTSGATESDNWAIRGILEAYNDKGKHIITTAVEHPAILATLENLQKEGYRVTYLPVDEKGQVSIGELKTAICEDTVLITIMAVNNETGITFPIKELCEIAKKKNILFHTDAVQAFGKTELDVKKMGVDLMSISSHKIGGAKGVGALYIKKGVRIAPLIFGGSQERDKRSGTYNTPAISSFGIAAKQAKDKLQRNKEKLMCLRERFKAMIENEIPSVIINEDERHQSPAILSLSFEGIDSQALNFALDSKGIAASVGSACAAGDYKTSHVIQAMNKGKDIHSFGTIRFSFGVQNTVEEIEECVGELKRAYIRLGGKNDNEHH